MTEQVQELPAVAPSEENAGRALQAFGANVAGRLVPWLVPVGLIVFWQIASSLGWLSTRVLPAPVDVVKAAWGLAVSGELWTHVKVSAGRALAGLAIGGGTGLVLGLLTGSVKFFETLLDSTIQMVRSRSWPLGPTSRPSAVKRVPKSVGSEPTSLASSANRQRTS